jgi:agarase
MQLLSKIKLFSVIAFSCSAFICMVSDSVNAQRIKLSPEGLERKAAHEFLFEDFVKSHQAVYKGKGDNRNLDEVILHKERIEVDGDLKIELPEGAQRIASMFRYFLIRGENLDRIGSLKLLPYSPDGTMHVSTRETGIYRVQMPSLPMPSAGMQPMIVVGKSTGKAVITEVAFISQGRLKTTFDDLPYRNLGAEYPREQVDVLIDLNHELSIEGHVDLERSKFFRFYARPGMPHPSLEQWAWDHNFLPGRQINKLQYSLVKGYSPKQPKLKEDKSRPGYADLGFFKKYRVDLNPANTLDQFRDIDFAVCFDNYPDFMSVPQVGRGTPKVEHFDAAAELVATYIKNQIKNSGRATPFYEVKNESTIKSEWDHHWKKGVDSWALLSEFHSKIADAVHKQAPGAKVGGPSSAWMQLQVDNFGLYEKQRKFMDLTKGKLDFYSHHFYENRGTIGAWERRGEDYKGYLLGSMEAILDMFQAHMRGSDNVRPILITECGSLQPGRGPSDYWLRLRSFSAFMHKLSRRPHEIELAVPFVFLNVPWNPQSGDAAFIPNDDNPPNGPIEGFSRTPVHHFFELWKDFDGRRLPVKNKRPFLDVTALHNAESIQVAITNMGGKQLKVDLSQITGEPIATTSVTQKRLYYQDGEVRFDSKIAYPDATRILVDVEETTVVTLGLEEPLSLAGEIKREFWFAPETAVKHDELRNKEFTIDVDEAEEVKACVMRVGLHRVGGLHRKLEGTFNGKPFKLEVKWAGELNNLFATIDVPVPIKLLKTSNSIILKSHKGLTLTALHLSTDK